MAGATTLAAATEVLKEVYEDPMRDQIQSEAITLKRIEQTSEGVSEDVGGKYVTFPLRVRRNHGIGARRENEPLPTPRTQKYAKATLELAYLYGAVSLTGQSLKLAEKKPQSFVSLLEQEVTGLKEGLVKDVNRQVYGSSLGILCTIPAGTAGFTHTVSSTQYLEPGMVIDVLDSAGGVLKVEEAIIDSINTTTLAVTFNKSFTSANSDILTRWRNYGKEKIGFQEVIDDDSTVYGISPSVEPLWKSVVNHNGGTPRAISEGLMIKVTDDIRTNGGKTTVIFTSLGVRRSYFNLLVQQRRYHDTTEFAGGFKGLKFTTDNGDIPLISDFDAPNKTMWFTNEDELKLYQADDWSFMDYDGSKWQRVITAEGNFDAYEAMYHKYCQLGTHRRNSHGRIDDVAEATG